MTTATNENASATNTGAFKPHSTIVDHNQSTPNLTKGQWDALHLAYTTGAPDALLEANGTALKALVGLGLLRRAQTAKDPATDRRAQKYHNTYQRSDRELYWRFTLTEEGRRLANRLFGGTDKATSVTRYAAAGRAAWEKSPAKPRTAEGKDERRAIETAQIVAGIKRAPKRRKLTEPLPM